MYKEYKDSQYWNIIEESLDALEGNNDIEFLTGKEYIVGYLVEKLELVTK